MIRRPPRSTLDRSSAASDVYKRQGLGFDINRLTFDARYEGNLSKFTDYIETDNGLIEVDSRKTVSYTHLRAHETVLDLVCRLLLEKKNKYEHKHMTCLTMS